MENYKEQGALARAVLDRRPEISQVHYPLDDFIIHMPQLAELVIKKEIQRGEVKKILSEMDALTDEVHEYYHERDRARKEKALASE